MRRAAGADRGNGVLSSHVPAGGVQGRGSEQSSGRPEQSQSKRTLISSVAWYCHEATESDTRLPTSMDAPGGPAGCQTRAVDYPLIAQVRPATHPTREDLVKRSYSDEIEGLPTVYAAARAVRESDVSSLRADLTGGSAVFVGAGGTVAVAKLGAELHERFSGSIARVATPLEFASQPAPATATVVLISARARHPDTAAAAAAALAAGNHKILLLTQRAKEDLSGSLAHKLIAHHHVPAPCGNDGFLATGSLLATAVLLARAYAGSDSLPDQLPSFDEKISLNVRSRLLVLSAPGLSAPATDLETRFNETGLADVEVTDYRNFAHGRHYGLSRRMDATSLIALSSDDSADIAHKTLRTLPNETQIIRLDSSLSWPGSALDLLVKSAKLIQQRALIAGVDPANPSVPAFGRRLYHLTMPPKRPRIETPIQRKLNEAIEDGLYRDVYVSYHKSLETWINLMSATAFAGLVLDYDGTVCATRDRFDLPAEDVRKVIELLVVNNVKIGFASGRGKSLYSDLRKWVPASHWHNIFLGLYNGAVNLTLADDLPSLEGAPSESLTEAYRRLEDPDVAGILSVKVRPHQLSVRQAGQTTIPLTSLYEVVASVLNRAPTIKVSLRASGHSLDIVRPETSKTAVLKAVQDATGSPEVIAIGDQGQRGGNDYDLLAAVPYTLSVDRCSSDPTRCWNLNPPADRGPDGLVKYLRALKTREHGRLKFMWSGLCGMN